MRRKANTDISTAEEAFKAYSLLDEKLTNAIWVELGKMMKIQSKKLHDYYHNTFSKRFYANLNDVKEQAVQLLE